MRFERRTVLFALIWPGLALVAPAQDESLIHRGREVFVAEGCIHCHSQYVRPATVDEVRWGPPLSLAEISVQQPPLLGNRRQGPDLQNIGARRSAEWQRLHLQSPRLLTPGSRMPSYAHLFSLAAHGAGEALIAYLANLGKGRQTALEAKANDWQPVSDAGLPVTEPRQLYGEYCTGCHGATGRGDGPLAARLKRSPRDLTKAKWIAVPPTARGLAEQQSLARIIKYGISGSAMAGREYLTDAETVALARYVQSLRITP